jgi:hypothetical protein
MGQHAHESAAAQCYRALDLTITTLGDRGRSNGAHHGLEKAMSAQDLAGDEEGLW